MLERNLGTRREPASRCRSLAKPAGALLSWSTIAVAVATQPLPEDRLLASGPARAVVLASAQPKTRVPTGCLNPDLDEALNHRERREDEYDPQHRHQKGVDEDACRHQDDAFGTLHDATLGGKSQ